MIKPFECNICQNYFCKKCIEECNQNNDTCPKKCENSICNEVIEKKNLIRKFKFKCIKGCDAEILFDKISEHYIKDCSEEKKVKFIEKDEIQKLKKENVNLTYITSKNYIIFIFSNHLRGSGSWKDFSNQYVRLNI